MDALVIILLSLILISVGVGFYAVVKQQGRILLRLDQIEQNAKLAAAGAEDVSDEAEPGGLALTTDFPAFQFPDLTGKTVALQDFRGKRVLLVHWNFECGFCDSIAPDLAALETGLEKANVALVLLAYGDLASNQKQAYEYALKFPLLLMKDDETPGPFSQQGTPVAYLLDEVGRVDAPFASGADRVLSLAKALATSRSEDVLSRSSASPGFGDQPQTLKNRSAQPLPEPGLPALPSQLTPTDTTRRHEQAPRYGSRRHRLCCIHSDHCHYRYDIAHVHFYSMHPRHAFPTGRIPLLRRAVVSASELSTTRMR